MCPRLPQSDRFAGASFPLQPRDRTGAFSCQSEITESLTQRKSSYAEPNHYSGATSFHQLVSAVGGAYRSSQRGRAAWAQYSTICWSRSENALATSLSTSTVPITRSPPGASTGTIISESVLPNAVRYRGSFRTSPTTTVFFC